MQPGARVAPGFFLDQIRDFPSSPRAHTLPLMKLLLPLAATLLLSTFAFAKEGWTEDFAKAKTQAKAEHKQILLDFTGSDWCPWCMKLNREVFSQKEWKEYAAQHYVLVEVDFPQHKSQSPALKRQNETLSNKYHVEGFPTVVVLNSDGARRGQVGYTPGGPKAFIKAVEKIH
jgi:protein disulfide-isomerase